MRKHHTLLLQIVPVLGLVPGPLCPRNWGKLSRWLSETCHFRSQVPTWYDPLLCLMFDSEEQTGRFQQGIPTTAALSPVQEVIVSKEAIEGVTFMNVQLRFLATLVRMQSPMVAHLLHPPPPPPSRRGA